MKELLLKISALLLLLIGMNWVYTGTSFKHYAYEESDQLFQIEKAKNSDILYVSASSNFSQNPQNEEPKKLSQYLSDFFPSLLVEAINVPASHSGTHATLIETIPVENHIKTLVCVVNIRSFGPDWQNSPLETALNQQMVMLNNRPPLLNRLLTSLNAYDHKSVEEREAQRSHSWNADQLPYPSPRSNVTEWCALEKWGDWRDPKRQLADQYIKQFAFVIDETNPRISDLDKIVSLSKERSWNLVLSILPENLNEAESLVGSELKSLIVQNRDWIKDRYTDQVTIVDNLDLLDSDEFADRDFPTEHYTEHGRKATAARLALTVRNLHPTAYQNATWATNMTIK